MFNEQIWAFSNSINLLSETYCSRSFERISSSNKKFTTLFEEYKLPKKGFSELEIRSLLNNLAFIDSNNWISSVGVGEREGRLYCSMVKDRHFNFAHGIGRSGDLTAIQPKAPGSSFINTLTNKLILDWIRISGCPAAVSTFVSPMATGMTLTLCLQALKLKSYQTQKQFVIWPRIDQKSCFKSVLAAGLIPVPIELHLNENSDELVTDLTAVECAIKDPVGYLKTNFPDLKYPFDELKSNPENVLAILSTTSCFAPRIPDKIYALTKLCLKYKISHLINNAYGVQSEIIMRKINACGELIKKSKTPETQTDIDLLFVQSTDKNLLVPVGGAIVCGFDLELVKFVAEMYPGRASISSTLDVFITLLHMGQQGWLELCAKRGNCFVLFKERLQVLADKYDLVLLNTPSNPISLAISFKDFQPASKDSIEFSKKLTLIGSHLFTQGCSGVRVVLPADENSTREKTIALNYTFKGYGSHSNLFLDPYLNVASAIGQDESEIDIFCDKFAKALHKIFKI